MVRRFHDYKAMKKLGTLLSIGFFIAAFSLASAFAQTTKTDLSAGYLKGEIVDPRGAVIPNVSIIIEAENFRRVALTDDEGNYKVELPVGVYRITAEKVAFRRFRQKQITIEPKVVSKLNISLKYEKPVIVDEKHP